MATKPTQNFSLYLDEENARQLRARIKRTGKKVGVLFLEAMQSAADAEKRMAGLQAQVEAQAAEMAQRDDTEAMGEARYQDGYQDGMAAGRAAVLQEQPALESALSLLGTQRAIAEGKIRQWDRESQQRKQDQAEAVQQGYADGVELGKKNAVSEMIALSYRDPETLRRMYDEEEAKIRGYVAAQVRREFALRP